MTDNFEPVFFQPLYDGDVLAAFPEVSRRVMTDAYDYWAHQFYHSLAWFYRAQRWQHEQVVGRAFNAKYPPEYDWDDELFQEFADTAGLWAHAQKAQQALEQLEFFRRKDELTMTDGMAEYRDYLDAIRHGRKHAWSYKQQIDEVWFNWQIDPNADEVRCLRRMPYSEYLLTPHWRRVRAAMIVIYGAHCDSERCYGMDSYWLEMSNLQVHHLTYANRGRERYADLKLLCEMCHKMTHDAKAAMP